MRGARARTGTSKQAAQAEIDPASGGGGRFKAQGGTEGGRVSVHALFPLSRGRERERERRCVWVKRERETALLWKMCGRDGVLEWVARGARFRFRVMSRFLQERWFFLSFPFLLYQRCIYKKHNFVGFNTRCTCHSAQPNHDISHPALSSTPYIQ